METEKPKARRGLDSELQTMAKIDRLLAELDIDQQHRVMDWLHDRYGRPVQIKGLRED